MSSPSFFLSSSFISMWFSRPPFFLLWFNLFILLFYKFCQVHHHFFVKILFILITFQSEGCNWLIKWLSGWGNEKALFLSSFIIHSLQLIDNMVVWMGQWMASLINSFIIQVILVWYHNRTLLIQFKIYLSTNSYKQWFVDTWFINLYGKVYKQLQALVCWNLIY